MPGDTEMVGSKGVDKEHEQSRPVQTAAEDPRMTITNVLATRRLDYTALHQSVLDARLQQVRLLLTACRHDPNYRDFRNRTPLILCAFVENEPAAEQMARLLLEMRAVVLAADYWGKTALHYAVLHSRQRLVRLLLRHDITAITDLDNDGRLALHHAAETGNAEIAQTLVRAHLANFATVDVRDKVGYTPLTRACRMRHYCVAAVIVFEGRCTHDMVETDYKMTALQWIRQNDANDAKAAERNSLAVASSSQLSIPHRSPVATPLGQSCTNAFYREYSHQKNQLFNPITDAELQRCGTTLPVMSRSVVSRSQIDFSRSGVSKQRSAHNRPATTPLQIDTLTEMRAKDMVLKWLESKMSATRNMRGSKSVRFRADASEYLARLPTPRQQRSSLENLGYIFKYYSEAMTAPRVVRQPVIGASPALGNHDPEGAVLHKSRRGSTLVHAPTAAKHTV